MLERATRRFLSSLALSGLIVAVVWVCCGFAQRENDFRPERVVQPFPPITEFPLKPVKEAYDALNPSELVLGVRFGKEARAYPINMLTGPSREILNDTLGGKAIAATW